MWVWVNSGRWWWTGMPGVLRFMGLQRVGHTEWLNWNELWFRASLVAQTVKRLPTMQETRVQSLGQVYPLEKEMATHSSTLAWKITRTEEPGRLQSMRSKRVGHDWMISLWMLFRWLNDKESTFQCRRREFDPWFGKILWRRKWQCTPVFLLRKSHGQSLEGHSLWCYKTVRHDLVTSD